MLWILYCLYLFCIDFPQFVVVCNVWVSCIHSSCSVSRWQLCHKSTWTASSGTPFTLFPRFRGPSVSHSGPRHIIAWCAMHLSRGCHSRAHWNLQLVQAVVDIPLCPCGTSPCQLHWFPICFWVQFKMPIKIYLVGGWITWENYLSPVISAWAFQLDRVGSLQVPLIQQCHLTGPQKHAFFSVAAPVC